MTRFSIITPVLNEADSIEHYINTIVPIIEPLGTYEILFINDGSTDETAAIIQQFQTQNPAIELIELTRNHGKEIAVHAGLEHCKGDCAIPVDVDLQDPPTLIPQLVEKWEAGFKLVNAKRADRSDETKLKAYTASGFYHVFNKLSSTKIPPNVGDFRLIDREVIDVLMTHYPERNRFLKGLLMLISPNATEVEYKRPQREIGVSKYPSLKLIRTALDGITAFSTAPIFLITLIGFAISGFAFCYLFIVIFLKVAFGVGIPGYTSIIATILLLGGFQIFALGLIGNYIGKIYIEVKARPLYTIRTYHDETKS